MRTALGLAALTCAVFLGCSDTPTLPADGFAELEVVASGLSSPVYVTSPPEDPGRLFVLEKPGRVRVVRDGELLPDPFLDITAVTSSVGEQGLLGLAFHPSYASNGLVFVYHTDAAGDTRIVRYSAASPDLANEASALVVLEVDQPYSNHNGGHITFGPDGYLYIGLGDGGSGGDPEGHGQDTSTLLGSILRIDVDGGPPYGVPADNPFVATQGAAPEIWVYGLRNPWRFSFDRATGDLYIGDVGQNRLEEISVQNASSGGGENFGWNVMEGTECFAVSPCATPALTLPVYEYDHDDGCSVTGGYVYRGSALPELEGRYLFGDYCTGLVRSFRLSGGEATQLLDHSADLGVGGGLASFGEDALGELYVVDIGGTVYRIVPAG